MSNIVSFGEIMMRLNPEGYLRFVQAQRFETTFAGGEANVAVSLANYGHHALFVSKVPEHEIGQCAVNALRQYGVDTSYLVRGGERLGLYFVEKGASQRGSKVIYDRSGSSIAKAKRKDFDWEKILDQVHWFHWTGITPALGDDLPDILMDALQVCRKKDITVSCDLNYRSKLWSREKARDVMSQLCQYVDVMIANEEDAKDVFGIAAEKNDIDNGKLNDAGYIDVAKQLKEKFSCKAVAITLRGSVSASDNEWGGMLDINDQSYFSKKYMIRLVDRVGGGDSFGGALIHAMLMKMDPQDIIEFAVAASCLKQTIEHDFNLVSVSEVMRLVKGNASGRVQR